MTHQTKKLPKSEMEITITVAPADYENEMKQAAKHLSEVAAIKGFRPGAAPYDIIKQQMGEQKILETALERIIQKNYFAAVKEEKLETVGMPMVNVEKLAPGNDIVFTAKVALLPKIKLADLSKIKVEAKKIEINEKELENTLNDLRKMRRKEVIKNDISTQDDKMVVDMEMFINKVAVDGGWAKDHQVYLSEGHYIPGFAEKLIGLKKDDNKEFSLKFPAEHYQKQLAGKDVDFKVKVKDVFSLELPELNDDFAKGLGQTDLEKLKALLKDNLTREAEIKEAQRQEAEVLEKLVENSQFEEIPETLLKTEKQKMFHELKHDLEHRGIEIEQYLKDAKKSQEQIFDDFAQGAEKRVKAALVARQVAEENKIEANKEEMEKEIELIKATYGSDPQVEENLKQPETLETIARMVQNRKVVEWLKEKVVKKNDK